MKRVITIILVTCFLFGCAGNRTWTKQDTAREVTWEILHVVDWQQTRYIANHRYEYHELNPILGSHPSERAVNIYMGVSAIAHPIISYALPDPYRKWFQYLSIGVTSGCVINNIAIGIPIW